MPIISDPALVFYTCIAKGTTILAEFNREQSPDLSSLAKKCIDATPQHHSIFSQTYLQRTYTFLIDDPFVYFAVYGLGKPEGIQFLNGVKIGFCELIKNGVIKKLNFDRLGVQPHLDFIVRGLIFDLESVSRNPSLDFVHRMLKKKKKKKRFNGEREIGKGDKEGNLENKVDIDDDEKDGFVQKNSHFSTDDRQKAVKQVWKKHVWVLLLLDVFMCAVLFGVWLWVCRGFQCIIDS